MGLDMYAYTAPANAIEQSVDINLKKVEGLQELFYWRKHPNLHGFMEELYYAKGGAAVEFNCAPLVLTFDDLTRLEGRVLSGALPDMTGFFFGESDGSERENDLAFIAAARAAIAEGKAVIYDSWW